MKIAFFSPAPFSMKFGATKNRIELAEALKVLGWTTFIIGNEELGLPIGRIAGRPTYRPALKEYLLKHAADFDVIVYEYDTLPYDRELFCKSTLFIARPALLHYNFDRISIPYDFKTNTKHLYEKVTSFFSAKAKKNDNGLEESLQSKSLQQSNLIQVQNKSDSDLLKGIGYSGDKIIIVPNGISEKRWELFKGIEREYDAPHKVAFVGSFDYRKGAMDFPYIVSMVKEKFPDCKFKLLGTKGLFQTEEGVLNFFPAKLRPSIEVISNFEAEDLPELLRDCHAGIFPSYIESFGFGALEMMAAGLPVLGYKSPGPSDFLLEDLLVEIGDKKALARKLVEILSKKNVLKDLSVAATERASKYLWSSIALKVSEEYKSRVQLNTFA